MLYQLRFISPLSNCPSELISSVIVAVSASVSSPVEGSGAVSAGSSSGFWRRYGVNNKRAHSPVGLPLAKRSENGITRVL